MPLGVSYNLKCIKKEIPKKMTSLNTLLLLFLSITMSIQYALSDVIPQCTIDSLSTNSLHPDCGVREYCSSTSLQCLFLTQHPKWGSDCASTIVVNDRVCGESLQCFQHKCYQCDEGSRNVSNGMLCSGHMWIYERSSSIIENFTDVVLKRDPMSIFLICAMGVFFLTSIGGLFFDMIRIWNVKSEISELEKEMVKDGEFMDQYIDKMEKERSKRAKKMKQKQRALSGRVVYLSSDEEDNSEDSDGDTGNPRTIRHPALEESAEIELQEIPKSEALPKKNEATNETFETQPVPPVQRRKALPLTPLQIRHMEALRKLQNATSVSEEEASPSRLHTALTNPSQNRQPMTKDSLQQSLRNVLSREEDY